MALPASDNFNRADVDPIAGNWSTIPNLENLQIYSNALRLSTSNTSNGIRWNADAFNNDQYSFLRVTARGEPPWYCDRGACVRVSASAATFYMFDGSLSNGVIDYYKCVAGTFTKIGSPILDTINNGDTLKLKVEGTTLTGTHNEHDHATRTDSTIVSGSAGIWMSGFTAGAATTDDWEGGDVAAGGGAVPIGAIINHYRQCGVM